MENKLYLNISVCSVEQVAEKTTECDRHADVVILETGFCDVVRVKVDVHELFAIVGDGPVKPFNHTKAQEDPKDHSIITKSHVESCLLVYCLLTTAVGSQLKPVDRTGEKGKYPLCIQLLEIKGMMQQILFTVKH